MDHFKRLRSVNRDEVEQMAIYAMCRRFKRLDERQQAEIRALIADIAMSEREGRALFLFLTTGMTFLAVTSRCCVPEGRLNRMRAEFFRRWEW